MRKHFIIIVSLSSFLSCQGPSGLQMQDGGTRYFDMDSLITSQISHLIDRNPDLQKKGMLAGEISEDITMHPDSMEWEDEFKIFRESNINRPAYQGVYTVNKGVADTNSNLLVDFYIGSEQEQMPVKSLKVYYLKDLVGLKKLEIVIKVENELFLSERKLTMRFYASPQGPLVSGYHVEGNQKLTMHAGAEYLVEANIVY